VTSSYQKKMKEDEEEEREKRTQAAKSQITFSWLKNLAEL